MAQLPISADVAQLVGDFGEKIQNRSLLLDKFVFHKKWGTDDIGAPDAHRWSLLRVSDGGSAELNREAQKRREQAGGNNVQPQNADRLRRESDLASRLASTQAEAPDTAKLRQQHTRRFLALFRGAYGDRAAIRIGKLERRLAINLADGLIQNAGICLDRTFGLPHLPGSAVKGVSRHAALEQLATVSGEERSRLFHLFRRVFGTADNDFSGKDAALKDFQPLLGNAPTNLKGAVSFLPAWPVNEAKVVVDLTTVHYPDYYRSGNKQDQQKEKPLPNPFPAVEAGACFAFSIVLNGLDDDQELLAYACTCLESALTVRGIGAKTASGYGWFSIDQEMLDQLLEEERKVAETEAAAEEKARLDGIAKAAEEIRIDGLSPEDLALERFAKMDDSEFANEANHLEDLTEEKQRAFFKTLTSARKDKWKAWKKGKKPNAKERVEKLTALAKTLKIDLP